MEIQRNFYLDKLITRKSNGLVKVITGLRRCGKSYLLNTIFYRHLLENGVPKDHIIRFAFDSADDLYLIGENLIELEKKSRKANPEKFMAYVRSIITDSNMYYLLDEVQMLDCFETVLNGYLRKENMDVYVTGSNAKFLSSDIITEFAGRGDEIHMYPLSFSEFMSVYPGDKYEGLSQYMLYGGIPMIVLKDDEADKAAVLNNLFHEIYIRDILKRHKIKKYLDYFEDSFLMEAAQRYDIRGKAYIETPKKYYFSDLGLRNSRINFRQYEQTHMMENVLYNELRMRGYNVDVGVVTITQKDSDGKSVRKQLEVDFVCNAGSNRYYIQSAYSMPNAQKHEQETEPFRKIGDSFKKIVVTKDIIPPHYDEHGIFIINIYDFLLDPSKLEH